MMLRIFSSICLLLITLEAAGAPGPFSREDIITRSLAASGEIEAARCAEDLLRIEKRISIIAFFPRLSAGLSATETVVYHSPDARFYRIYAGFEQPVFTGGALIEDYRSGRDSLEIHRYNTESIMNAVVLEETADYARLILLEARLEAQRMAEDLLNRQLRAAGEEHTLGLITELTLDKMRLARDRQSLAVNSVETQYRELRRRFAGRLEIEPAALLEPAEKIRSSYAGSLRVEASPGSEGEFPPGPERFIASARTRNPGLAARKIRAASAGRSLGHAKRFWIPRITLNGEVFVTGDRLPLSVPGFTAGVDISLPLPFFPLSGSVSLGTAAPESRFVDLRGSAGESPSTGGTLLAARAAYERAELDLRTARVDLEEKIISSYHQIIRAGELIDREIELLNILESELIIAGEELRIGEIGRLEYMEAAAECASQRDKILENQFALFVREIELYALSGFSLIDEAFPLYERFLENRE